FLRGRGALWFMPLPISRVQALVERPAPHDPAPAGRQRPHDHGPLLGPVGLRPHGLGLGACGAVGLPADRPCRSPPQGPDALPTVPWSGEGEPLFHSSAMACSAAIRFSVAGCVEKSESMRSPCSGLMMNRCAVAGLRSAAGLRIASTLRAILASAEASHSGWP